MALGVAGWAAADRLRLPGASFLGPLLVVGAAAVLGLPQRGFPPWAVIAFQVTFGAFLGCQADQTSVARIRSMGWPVAVAALWTIVSAFAIALLLAGLTALDPTSSFLSVVPGGVAEMSAMSISMGANTAVVASMQSLRAVATMVIVPLLSARQVAQSGGHSVAVPGPVLASAGSAIRAPLGQSDLDLVDTMEPPGRLVGGSTTVGWLASLLVGLAGGLIFIYLQIPAGGILGAVATVTIGRIAGIGLQTPPPPLRLLALMGMGAHIGTSFSAETLVQLREIAFAAVLVTATTIGSGIVLAVALRKRFGLDATTAMLGCAPAGVSQMAIIAHETGGDVLVVTLLQLVRFMCCIFVLPALYAIVA